MLNKGNWSRFREEFPELADGIKPLAAEVYSLGSEAGGTSEVFRELVSYLKTVSPEALELLGLSVPLTDSKVLVQVFLLGAEILFSLEEGRAC